MVLPSNVAPLIVLYFASQLGIGGCSILPSLVLTPRVWLLVAQWGFWRGVWGRIEKGWEKGGIRGWVI